jgi:hypothetical protein
MMYLICFLRKSQHLGRQQGGPPFYPTSPPCQVCVAHRAPLLRRSWPVLADTECRGPACTLYPHVDGSHTPHRTGTVTVFRRANVQCPCPIRTPPELIGLTSDFKTTTHPQLTPTSLPTIPRSTTSYHPILSTFRLGSLVWSGYRRYN